MNNQEESRVRIRSLSYGGGIYFGTPTQPGGSVTRQPIDKGGFDVIFSLFDSSGKLLKQVDDVLVPGSAGTQIDPNTGVAFDAAIDVFLKPGSYTLKVSHFDNFSLQGRSQQINTDYPGFMDVTGSIRNSSYFVDVTTFKDLIDNVVAQPTINGNQISTSANFSLGQSLLVLGGGGTGKTVSEEVAKFGGFDHFNWYQRMKVIKGKPCRGDRVDPLPGGNCRNSFGAVQAAVYAQLGVAAAENALPGYFADQYPWYYDEVDSVPVVVNVAGKDISLGTKPADLPPISPGLSLEFSDTPGGHPVDTVLEFETYLAGIKTDKKGAVFAASTYNNTAFKWRYTQTNNQQENLQVLGLPSGTNLDLDFFKGFIPEGLFDPEVGGTIEFLGFLTEEEWKQRTPELKNQGVEVFGFDEENNGVTTTAEPNVALSVLALSLLMGTPKFLRKTLLRFLPK